jgi:plasmid stabilization system protein ParE
MPRGDKSAYTEKQKRQAEHIEEGYLARGVPRKEAERRACATENEMSGGGRKSGAGRGKRTNKAPARKGGRIGGRVGIAPEVGTVRLGAEGRRDPQEGGNPETQHPRECVPEAPVGRLGEEAVVGQQGTGTNPGRHQEALEQPAPVSTAPPDSPCDGALLGYW